MESIDADDVVIATQADVAARLLADVAPDAAARIGALRYNPLAIVQLEADTGVRGLGFQVGFETPPPMLRGVTFHDCLFGRSKLCTAFLGGARHPEVVELDEDALGVLAASELRRTLGCEARPLAAAHVRMPAWDLSWSGLADIALPPGLHVAGGWWSRPGLPGRFAEARRVAEKLHATD
jgi:oxygen-dependent protoporphyrinogen oxidase